MNYALTYDFARALLSFGWCAAIEGSGHEVPYGPGDAAEEYAPKVPDCLLSYAEGVLLHIQELNAPRAIEDVFSDNCMLVGHRAEPTLADFGWYLATEWMKMGPCWADDHPDHGLDIPYGEFNVHLDDDDPKSAYLSSGSLQCYVELQFD